MKRLARFVGVGSCFATVEEFLTVVVLRRDVSSYLFTLLVLFPVFLTFVWSSSRLIDRLVHGGPGRELVHFFAYGFLGLMMEWFLMGLAPWSNPGANPAMMLVFQSGMFSFWATVAFAPRLLLEAGKPGRRAGKALLRFYVPYFVLVYVIGFSVPERMRFAAIIGLILFGYLSLNLFYVRYFLGSFAKGVTAEV
jgi:hypothetical protein